MGTPMPTVGRIDPSRLVEIHLHVELPRPDDDLDRVMFWSLADRAGGLLDSWTSMRVIHQGTVAKYDAFVESIAPALDYLRSRTRTEHPSASCYTQPFVCSEQLFDELIKGQHYTPFAFAMTFIVEDGKGEIIKECRLRDLLPEKAQKPTVFRINEHGINEADEIVGVNDIVFKKVGYYQGVQMIDYLQDRICRKVMILSKLASRSPTALEAKPGEKRRFRLSDLFFTSYSKLLDTPLEQLTSEKNDDYRDTWICKMVNILIGTPEDYENIIIDMVNKVMQEHKNKPQCHLLNKISVREFATAFVAPDEMKALELLLEMKKGQG